MPLVQSISSSLKSWPEIKGQYKWTGILLGNGASRAVWNDFQYESLFDTASSSSIPHPLSAEDQAIFRELGTQNFELVLAALNTSRRICTALAVPCSALTERYKSIQRALFEAVSAVHVPWALIDPEALSFIRRELLAYRRVYSTNYDLLVYWAIMLEEKGNGFKDFLWGPHFDASNTEVWDSATCVYYLHGGIHLATSSDRKDYKRQAGDSGNLLQSLVTTGGDSSVPLFVTEGSARDKQRSISDSDYLNFAYQQFANHNGPLVVFGHSLSEEDGHLLDAMGAWSDRTVAVGIYPTDTTKTIALKTRLHERLPKANLIFFDSRSHPLGAEDLRVEPLSGWNPFA